MSWPAFVTLMGASYFLANALFALGYLSFGAGALDGPAASSFAEQALQSFFFSVHTMSTVGYGHIVPVSMHANALMALQSFVGLFGLAIATGLVFARFSRPTAKIVFSKAAIIAPYREGTALEFRIANQRKSHLIELEAQVIFSRMENDHGRRVRRFHRLPLERNKVSLFPLSWTIVHPINEESPFYGLSREELFLADTEILVLLTGIEETFSYTVHSRMSYNPDELIWYPPFGDIFQYAPDRGPVSVDSRRILYLIRLEPGSANVAS